jgi:hypothetical protein
MKRTKYTKIFFVRSVFFVVNALPADAADVVLICFVVTTAPSLKQVVAVCQGKPFTRYKAAISFQLSAVSKTGSWSLTADG